MEEAKLHLLHEHYRDTCVIAQGVRQSRDRYFYLIIAVAALVLFDVYSPADYSRLLSELLVRRLEIGQAPDLGYVRSLLWFLFLGLVIRYCQAVLLLERQYAYVHALEAHLAETLDPVFGREGRAYLAAYPAFLNWAHYLYTFAFPLLLLAVALLWIAREVPGRPPWPGLLYFDVGMAVALYVSVGLYLLARYRQAHREASALA
jgi:hypothetical protein